MDPPPGHRVLRRGRVDVVGGVYFVTTVTRGRLRAFADFHAACAVAGAGTTAATWPHAQLLAWVLMPDHWHGLVELSGRESLSAVISRFKASTARAYNIAHGRSGCVWARAFHDRALRAEDDVRTAARNLIANPLRAGLAETIGDYPFWDAVWM